MRVASGAEQNEHNVYDSAMELTVTRCAELICEAIPGCVLQFTAAMRVRQGGGTVSNIAVASIVISALTTGYSSACISFDYDVDPVKRRNEPDFYVREAREDRTYTLTNTHTSQGYIPDDALPRTLSFVCMILNGALLLLLRSFGAAMLIIANKNYFIAYMTGDMALYFAEGIADDMWYWIPIDMATSLDARVAIKVITDYSGVVQFRASGEVGGTSTSRA